MKVTKAVIPAAGLGTRVLPATKAMPKEMLTIVDKPAIQYIVEEAVASGITDICIVLSRGKGVVEDHFDASPELEQKLEASGKTEVLETVRAISKLANITYVRQPAPLGLGHAVNCAKSFVGKDPFAVLYGDDVIMGDYPCCKQLVDQYEKYGLGCVCMKEVPFEQVTRYSSLKVENLENNVYKVTDMVEKPATPELAFSNFSILGRCVLPGEIFDILADLPRGAGGEYQLTDAMKILATTQGMIGVDFVGTRYDMGNKLGIMQASVETALKHPEIGEGFRAYLKELAKTL
ncbi:MAG TPA: UTP--glucose-1-phosphate uridylyltransferase GalU [Candidatus Egerieicola faecale]|uniref:UTP--glucose-1-phosphate uridylyltransferase n=1 Tax=Candidatus Egerieicola faecale TaxID=2840774 RepID=A0A9D1IRS6_9FIRM|nr:UTP--glucose-1-phosphate uridylyltransferase GalU [Candidatus Egerieicola faecale]